MSGGFTKLFSSIVTSTIWREESHVRIVWITMLATCDRYGVVEASVPGLADIAHVTLDECVAALDRLQAPDPWSRTKEHEGRRIVPIDGGWRLLNHTKYRDKTGVQEDALSMSPEAVRQRRHRERERAVTEGVTDRDTVTERDAPVTPSASASVSESVVPETTTAKELDRERGLRDYCTRIAVAGNKGLGHEIPRVLASSGSTLQVAEILMGADIPVEFAERVIFERAAKLAFGTKADVRSLHYFTRIVCEEWEREGMKEQVARSPLAPGQRRKPVMAADVMKSALASTVDVRLCPICERMLDEPAARPHHERKHPEFPFTPFTDWKTL